MEDQNGLHTTGSLPRNLTSRDWPARLLVRRPKVELEPELLLFC
jgi:hypothetical protein